MGKSAPKAPAPPDPYETAAAEALYNRVDTVSPFGSMLFSGEERNRADITLSPEQQAIYDLQSMQGIRTGILGQQIVDNLDPSGYNYEGLPSLDVGDQRQYEQRMFDRQRALLDPAFNDQRHQMDTQLINRGLPMGSEASNVERDRFDRMRNEAYGQAAYNAVQGGSAEQTRLFNQQMAARNQLGQERAAEYQVPFNTLASLSGYSQLQSPQFNGASPVDFAGAQALNYQGQMNAYNAASQQHASQMNGMYGLLGAGLSLLPFSDRNMKEDIEPVSVLDKLEDLPVYRWKYQQQHGLGTEPHIGPMAQDVQSVFGVGDGHRLNVIDMLGLVLAGIKELNAKVDDTRRRMNIDYA